jgi:hypothetical protein
MYQNVRFTREVAQLVSVGNPLQNGNSFSITYIG